MADSYEIKNGRLILKNNGESYLDDTEKKKIPSNFTEIEFPPCYEQVYKDDFKWCKAGLARVTKLDFSKATRISRISDGAFNGAKQLKVVVLPKKVEYISEFKNCPNLVEFHIYDLQNTYTITEDEDKRLTVYASKVSRSITSFSNGFLADVGILYVPKSSVKKMEEVRDRYNDKLDIRPLPDDYTFPSEALTEPWHSGGTAAESPVLDTPLSDVEEAQEGPYEVVLVNSGRAKLKVLRIINETLNVGLNKAKDLTDNTPSTLADGVSEELAKHIKREIEQAGGIVNIKNKEVDGSGTAAKAKATTAPSAFSLNDVYGGPQYHCVIEGQSFGPVTVRQFANMARFGIVDRSTLVWKDGMPNWAYASTVADLQVVI